MEQRHVLAQTFGCTRYIYNWALRLRTDAFYQRGESLGYHTLSARLTLLKRQDDVAWLREVSSVPLQQTLRHQEKAFRNFFEKRTAYPKFKKKHGRQAAEYTTSAFKWDGANLTLAKMREPLRIVWSRPLEGTPGTVTVTLDSAGRYFVSLLCEVAQPEPLPAIEKTVGVDVGLSDLVTTSDGFKSGNPKHLSRAVKRLRHAQRCLSRKQKASRNRERARRRVARIHARIADQRNDFTHKLSTRLIRENQTICVEDLAVRNMVQNHSLARSISDAGWGEFVRQLGYKASWYGRTLVKIDRFYPSSKRCSDCGYVHDSMPLSVRSWACPECGTVHDRDTNAARNILAAGLAVAACGGDIRPLVHPSISGNPGETGT